jgi:hypothetical protein
LKTQASTSSISPVALIEQMALDEKLSYTARLLRSLALHYGVSAEFGDGRGGLVGQAHTTSPAAALDDIAWMPMQNA